MSNAECIDVFVSPHENGKALMVQGESTKKFLPEWKSLGGRFNFKLKAWVFSMKKEEELMDIIDKIRSGEIVESDPLKSSTLSAINKIAKNMQKLDTEDRKEVMNHLKATFYLE